MNIRFQCIGLICVTAVSLCAQQGRISGPTSGLVFDSNARGLRPVIGIPGAGTIGAPLDFAKDLAAAWVSPRLDTVIGTGTDGALHIYQISSDAAPEITLGGIEKGPQSVTFSPSGSAALLHSTKATYVVTGLPDAPKVAGTIAVDVAAGRPDANRKRPSLRKLAFAISDDGAYVLSNRQGAVQLQTTTGENRPLGETAGNAVLAFAPSSHDAAIADSVAGVVLYSDLAGSAASKVIAASDSKSSYSGLAFSVDGKQLHLANAEAHSVTTFDVQSGAQTKSTCECSPTTIVRMGKVFRLNDFSAQPLWLLDSERAEPRIVFVPAATSTN